MERGGRRAGVPGYLVSWTAGRYSLTTLDSLRHSRPAEFSTVSQNWEACMDGRRRPWGQKMGRWEDGHTGQGFHGQVVCKSVLSARSPKSAEDVLSMSIVLVPCPPTHGIHYLPGYLLRDLR